MRRYLAIFVAILLAGLAVFGGSTAVKDAVEPGRRIVRVATFGNLVNFDAGTATLSAGGNTTAVAHTLGATPEVMLATGNSTDTSSLWISAANTTHITIALSSGSSGVDRTIYWIVGNE